VHNLPRVASQKRTGAELVSALTVRILPSRGLLGRFVKHLRESAGVTLRELESRSGVNNSEIARLEAGIQDCRLDSFIRICAALGAPSGSLLDVIILVDPEPYVRAIETDTAFAKSVEKHGLEAGTASFLASVLAGLAAQLAISSKPTVAAIDIAYPNDEVRHAFICFAESLEYGATAKDRLAMLEKLKATPVEALKEMRLFADELFIRFYQSVKEGASTSPSHWKQMVQVGTGRLAQAPRQPRFRSGEELFSRNMLTDSATSRKTSDVKPKALWLALKKKLQTKTEATGRTALAAFLGVELSRVSQWLSESKSAREPGAEYALLMQAWLNDPRGAK